MEATELCRKSEQKKVAVLLNLIGDEGLEIYNTFSCGDGENARDLIDIKKTFEDCCSPKKKCHI